MKAVRHTGVACPWAGALRPMAWPMLPLGNRPWREYWIEWCAALDIRAIQVVLGDGADQVESYVQGGARWGVQVDYSFPREGRPPGEFLRRDPARWRSGLFVVSAPVFPRRAETFAPAPASGAWAAFADGAPAALATRDPAVLDAWLAGQPPPSAPPGFPGLDVRPIGSLKEYFDLNMALIGGEADRYLTPGYRRADKSFIGYNVSIPPSADVRPPVAIGNDCRLAAMTRVGPEVVIGNRVVVDRQAVVRRSVILGGTCVGGGLELDGRIVVGRRLIDPADGTTVDIPDEHLLSALQSRRPMTDLARRAFGWLAALAAQLLPGRFTRFTTTVDRMPALYRSADVFLHLSRDEAFGNVYVEALSCGLPVVAHDYPTARWILGEHGRLVDSTSDEAAAGALREALADRAPERAEARHAAAAERFAGPAVAAKYATFIREVAGL